MALRTDILERKEEILQWIDENQSKAFISKELHSFEENELFLRDFYIKNPLSNNIIPVEISFARINPEEDVMIGISFPRYSNQTISALRFMRDKKAKIISITDSEASPLAAISKYTLKARSDMASFVDSLVAPFSLLNALIVAAGHRKNADMAQTFDCLEDIWEEYGVFGYNDED